MKYTFSDLVDVTKVQRLNDLFYTATGIPGAVIDVEGSLVTCSGWQDVCTKFHRVNAETLQRCVESDTVFANQIGVGQKYTVYKCGNGLIVAASPITIGGEHVANFITSQYLFESPDRSFFLEQARRFGFDESAYMEAVGKIPVIDETKVQPFLEYFSEFAAMLGEMGLKQLRQLEAADALRKSEQRWATTLSSIGDAVIATDTDGGITFMNTVAERLTGWTLPEAATKPVSGVFNIINEQTRKAVDDPVAKVLKEGMIAGLANHTLLLSKDGREIPIDDSAAPIKDAAGNTIGVVLVFRDIMKRRAAEEALRESRTQMSRAEEIAHLGSWELDLVNNRLSWSDEVYRIFGLQPQEFGATYEAFLQAVHPDDRGVVDAAYSGSLREGRDTYEIEHRIVRRSSGEIRMVQEKCEHFRDETGRIIKSVGMVHDITDRKRAEQELREASAELERKVAERTAELRRSEGYLADAQRLSHTGSWVWDVAGNIFTYSSEENSRMYGVDKQKDLETEAVLRLVHPDDREMVRSSRDRSLREKVDTIDEFRIVLQDGTIKHMHTVRHPVLNDAGDVVQLVGTSVDITERKRAEEALRESEAYLAQAQRLAHTGSFAYDPKTREPLYWSAEMFRIFGFDPHGPLPSWKAWNLRIHPHDREKVRQNFESAFHEKVDTSNEYAIVMPDETIKHLHVIRHPVLNDAGDVVKVVGAAMDITDRKRAEEALRQSETYLAEAQRLTHTGSWARSMTGEVVYLSEEVYRIFGLDPREGLPSREVMAKLVHHDDLHRAQANIEKALREKVDVFDEYRIVLSDGTVKHLEVIRHPVLNDTGDVVQLLGTVIDVTERKRAEEALQRSEAYLAQAQRLTHVGSYALEVNSGSFVFVSDECARIFGVDVQDPSQLITETLFERIHGEDRESIKRNFDRSVREKTDTFDEYRIVLPDGAIKDIQAIRHPVLNEGGDVVQLVGTVVDITERKETLRFFQSMDRINRAMQGTNDLDQMMNDVLDTMLSIFESDRAFLVYPCDPDAPSFEIAAERTRTGYPARRGVILTADTANHFQLYLASAGAVTLGPGGDYPLEISRFGEKSKMMIALYPKTGKPWILGTHQCSYARVWSQGEKKLMEEIARRMTDVLTSLLAHRDLHESEERHRITLQTAMDGFFRTDMQGRFLEVNGAYCRMSGYSEQELLTMRVADVEAVYTPEMIEATLKRAVEVGWDRFESVHRRKDGSLFDVEISGQYQPIAGGQAVVFVRDITERKQARKALQDLLAELESRVQERTKELSNANESLQAANKELESFSYSVSHDLRAPLRAIDGFSKMVLKDYAEKLDDEGRRKLNVIRGNTQKMGQLIDDLLAFSRLGRKEIVASTLDMEALVQSAWTELMLINPERRIQFSVERLPHAIGDQTLIKEVVTNLLSNAIKFTEPRGAATIEVRAYPEEGRTVYFVKDNGVGFDMQYHDKLFGVFHRLHSADEFEGTGVGLAIVERIIHRHGGRVWAEGKVGEGATFYFTLARKE